jgi:small subunit ribosomal protein S18
MPRINNPKPPKRAPKIDTRRGAKKKPCSFCQHGVATVDYKDLAQLRKYISDRGKIRGRKVSGNCQQHQRDVTDAIKTARELALLPYTQRTVTERRGGRGNRDDRGPRPPRSDGDRPSASTSAPAESVNVEAPDVEAEEILAYVDATPVAEVELVEEVAE